MSDKLRVAVLGGTGMVGQRFITLLANHPWFEVTTIAASPRSAGKTYAEAVDGRWKLGDIPVPEQAKNIVVKSVEDVEEVTRDVDFCFSALNMPKDEIRALEETYAKTETPVVSNNSAHRWTLDVPMIIPEINPEASDVIPWQRKRLGTTRGFIAVKPNCSIQSYTPALAAWKEFDPYEVLVTTYQAISGAGKNFSDWPEMNGNVIPFISGEEEKSEEEEPEYDEHVWLSLRNARVLTDHIAGVIAEADASNADTYLSNAEAYEEKLASLDEEYQQAVSAAEKDTLLFGDRFPFRYMADDYGLTYFAAFPGCSAETEASFETIVFLADKVNELSLSSILTIEGTDHKIAETIRESTASRDQQILTMNSMQSTTLEDAEGGTSYLSIMEDNLEVLKEALK